MKYMKFPAKILGFLDSVAPERFVLFLGVIAILMSILIPPFQTPDEHTHFLKAVSMSYGHVRANKISPTEVGELLPSVYGTTIEHYIYMYGRSDQKVNEKMLKEDILSGFNGQDDAFSKFENTAMYPPVFYIPQAVGVFIARSVGLSVVMQLYVARIMLALAWTVTMFYAVRILPRNKILMLCVLALPSVYIVVASASSDAITFSMIALITSIVFRLRTSLNVKETRRMLSIVALCGVAMGLAKIPYNAAVLLLLLIPKSQFEGIVSRKKYLAGVIGISLLLTFSWTAFVHDIYVKTNPDANTAAQIQHLTNAPLETIAVMSNSLFFDQVSNFMVTDGAGVSTWFNVKVSMTFVVVSYLVIAALALVAPPKKEVPTFSSKEKIFVVLGVLACCYLVELLIYLSFNKPGSPEVEGLNARYFIPLLLPLLMVLPKMTAKKMGEYVWIERIAKIWVIAVGIVLPVLMYFRFYVA